MCITSGIEEFSIVILDVEPRSSQGLTFGMTSCDPSALRSIDNGGKEVLPADPDELMDRSEYWIVVKNLLSGTSNSDEGDVLTFQLIDSGETRSVNKFYVLNWLDIIIIIIIIIIIVNKYTKDMKKYCHC